MGTSQSTHYSHHTASILPTLALSALTLAMVGCGGGGGSSANSAPAVAAKKANINAKTGNEATYTVQATDADNDTLSFRIKTQPKFGTASIDKNTGKVTYKASNVVGEDTMVVAVSDGTSTTDVTLTINNQTEAVFDFQFYKTQNPETGNSQLVRYNPNDNNDKTNQTVVKKDVILGNTVFVISGDKDGDKTVYKQREYGVFLDPSASFETRMSKDRKGNSFEYKYYTDNILKRFDATNPDKETVIFKSDMLSSDLTSQGLKVIGDSYHMHVNPTDINNSYVQLKVYERLSDTIKGETSDNIKNTYITVRLSDSAMTPARTLKTVVSNSTGKTQGVLVNTANNARLQLCDAALTSCSELGDSAKGEFYVRAENTDYIYLNKAGSNRFYAFNKADNRVTAVTGANFPAKFDPVRHGLVGATGHGGSGVLSDFSSIRQTHSYLAEAGTAYAGINYNLDTKDGVWVFKSSRGNFELPQRTYKNAMIIKFEGAKATKVFDNGTGVDLGDASDDVALAEQINLVAVKDGNLFVETGKYDAAKKGNVLASGWVKAGSTSAKTLDTVFTSKVVPYFTAHNVPSVAVGDKIYVVEVPTDNGAGGRDAEKKRIYNVYSTALTDTNVTSSSVTPVRGRMFLERTANRASGIYEGSVITWNIANNEIKNLNENVVLGKTEFKDTPVSNVYGGRLGNIVGVGGMFGMHTGGHGDIGLVSAKSKTKNSVKLVNSIKGAGWIFD